SYIASCWRHASHRGRCRHAILIALAASWEPHFLRLRALALSDAGRPSASSFSLCRRPKNPYNCGRYTNWMARLPQPVRVFEQARNVVCGGEEIISEIEFAIEVFVRGHSAGRSRIFPYQVSRVGPLWLMRDAPRKNPRNYRKEEWIAHDVHPGEVDAIVRQHARGRFFVCAMIAEGEPDESTRTAYKALGYRLLATEGFFVQRMKRIPRPLSPVLIQRVRTPDLAEQLGKITRTRPISNDLLADDAALRQYVALDGDDIVGRVRSVDAVGATWCADMYVRPSHRRRGIGQALLSKLLRDDRARGSKCSVLTASHTGALLYPRVGYER